MVGLKPYNTWQKGRRKDDLIADMAAMVDSMPGYNVGFSQPIIDMVMDQIAGSHSDLAIKILGEDITESRRIAEQVKRIVESVPGSADVSIVEEPFIPQLQVVADRDRIAQYGLIGADVAELIEVAIGGKPVSQVFMGSRVYDVICRYNDISRDTPEKIGALMLTSVSGTMIPLSTVTQIRTTTGPSMISREKNQRFVTVSLNLTEQNLTTFVQKAQSKIEEQINYDRTKFQIDWHGQLENQKRAFKRLAVVIPITLIVMFLLLFFTFGKFRQAGLVMGMIPLSVFGGLLALVLRGMTFNVSSAVGFIALIGLSIQTAVIMLSHINVLRQRGKELKHAVIEGASHRLRPMMMTATVAIIGLLPASLATGIGSDVQRPLATVIVYGLFFATIFTLFILPTLYYLMERYYEKKEALSPNEDE